MDQSRSRGAWGHAHCTLTTGATRPDRGRIAAGSRPDRCGIAAGSGLRGDQLIDGCPLVGEGPRVADELVEPGRIAEHGVVVAA